MPITQMRTIFEELMSIWSTPEIHQPNIATSHFQLVQPSNWVDCRDERLGFIENRPVNHTVITHEMSEVGGLIPLF